MAQAAESFHVLAGELVGLFRAGVDSPLPSGAFNELALRVFRFQCRANPAYGGFARARGVDPGSVDSWEDIPHLPTLAFKSRPLVSGDPDEVERTFLTSGTTGGLVERGKHHVRSLELYREALLPNFLAHLIPEGRTLPILSLLPSPEDARGSSLSFMVGAVAEAMGELPRDGPSHEFFLEADGEMRAPSFLARLLDAEEAGVPILLTGTAFAFANWLDVARDQGWRVGLAPGSRIMETGGYKGRVRARPREDLYGELTELFGIPPGRIVNEYGMTELLSQFYEPVLARGAGRDGVGTETGEEPGTLRARFHRSPPWVGTRVLDPVTLEPLREGETGILAHLDLANLGSVAAVLTEDLGRLVPEGFQLLGRAPGAEPRGCSLAMEAFLGSREGSP